MHQMMNTEQATAIHRGAHPPPERRHGDDEQYVS